MIRVACGDVAILKSSSHEQSTPPWGPGLACLTGIPHPCPLSGAAAAAAAPLLGLLAFTFLSFATPVLAPVSQMKLLLPQNSKRETERQSLKIRWQNTVAVKPLLGGKPRVAGTRDSSGLWGVEMCKGDELLVSQFVF